MGETLEKMLPGTAAAYVPRSEKGFSKIEMLLEATGGLSLSQVCAVTGLEGTTIQNWVKRGWVNRPDGKKYEEIHIARILIINALKECIKLEHIALLMSYINGSEEGESAETIKESELYNFLCDALQEMGHTDDRSKGGTESVVETILKDYAGPRPDSRIRIKKALTLMIFACVCTDVKRRTEAMMDQILSDLQDPGRLAAEAAEEAGEKMAAGTASPQQSVADAVAAGTIQREPDAVGDPDGSAESRKTISQTLRQWDFTAIEKPLSQTGEQQQDEAARESAGADKAANRPWYLRRGAK